jgi:hypothetical protein
MTTSPTSARLAALAQGDVGQDLGGAADDRGVGLTAASPVSMPTLVGPKTSHRAKNFSLTSALIGAV